MLGPTRARTLASLVAIIAAMSAQIMIAGPSAGAARTYNYVALGDSYTAATGYDRGSDTTFAPLGCFQSRTNYPRQLVGFLRRQHQLGTFVDASCGGATTAHATKAQRTPIGINRPQLSRITKEINLVTIGIGGNDAGLIPLAQQCVEYGLTNRSCKAAHVRGGADDITAAFAVAEPKIEAVITAVRARAARDVRILIVNYLEAVPDNGRGCFPTVPVLPMDSAWFTQKFRQLNAMLATAARHQNAQLVDTYTPSIGHNVCTPAPTRYVEFVGVVSSNPAFSLAAPLHPNIGGAHAQARAVIAAVARR